MAIGLTRGSESRLDGAPRTDLPAYADWVDAQKAALRGNPQYEWASDQEIDRLARMAVDRHMDAIESQEGARRARMDAQAAQAAQSYGRRQADRAQARGVDPNTLPPGASASDVQLMNRPASEVEAQLAMEQDAADRIVRGLREGTPTFDAQGDLDFLRERGDQNPLDPAGRTDMAMRDRIRSRRGQGFEMPDGTVIPTGREPTAAEIRDERAWWEWANQTPGSERQAKYDPAAYAQHREGVAQEIQRGAREDMATYGTGPADSQARADLGLPALTADQQAARDRRSRSQDRVAESQREVLIARLAQRAGVSREEARKMMDAGRAEVLQGRQGDAGEAGPAGPAGAPLTAAERRLESQRLRDAANTRQDALRANDLAVRRDNLRNQRLLLAPGGKGVANAINELPEGWRQIAILDRLTNGRVGGPTPLGVEQFQAEAIANGVGRALTGVLSNMDPNAAGIAARNAEMQRQQAIYTDAENFVALNFAAPAANMGATPFTVEEQRRTLAYLMGKYGLTLPQAQPIVDSIAAGRRPPEARPPAADAPLPPNAGMPPAGGRMPL